MTTPPQPPKLTISRAPAVLSWNRTPTPLPRYAYGRIIADCVDCGEETWWLRGRSADGGNSVSLNVATGRSYRVGYLLSNDPDLPIPDEPRCYDCTAYRALPWWRRWLAHRPRCIHDYERIGYGGAGWWVYQCRHCGEREIGHG